MKLTVIDLLHWKSEYEVLYAHDRVCQKMLIVTLSGNHRVVHGREIIYEGIHDALAIEKFNAINSAPVESEQPKLDN